jgi:hypothetical protein
MGADETPIGLARRFLAAVREGKTDELWDLLSPAARTHVLDVGEQIGVPASIIGRMRIGTADDAVRSTFLDEVLVGIRADLRDSDLDRLEPELVDRDDHSARVGLVEPIGDGVGPPMPPLPAAWLVVSRHERGWVIDRIDLPR